MHANNVLANQAFDSLTGPNGAVADDRALEPWHRQDGVGVDDRSTETDQTSNEVTAMEGEAAIRDLFRQLLDAWGRGDGPVYGALFTDEAEYVAFDGSIRRGTHTGSREPPE